MLVVKRSSNKILKKKLTTLGLWRFQPRGTDFLELGFTMFQGLCRGNIEIHQLHKLKRELEEKER